MNNDKSPEEFAENGKMHSPRYDSTAASQGASYGEALSRQLFLNMRNQEHQGTKAPSKEPLEYCIEMFDSAPLGYVNLDSKGTIKGINLTGANLLAEERPDLMGKPFHLYVVEDDRERFFNHLRRCQVSSERITSDLRLSSRKGDIVDVHLVSSPFADFSTNEPLYRTAITDITELKRSIEEVKSLNLHLSEVTHELEIANAELKEANKDLEVFNYSASHDLRAPLNTISLYSQLILELYSNNLDEEGTKYIKGILEQTERMSELLACLLELSHSSHKELNRETCDLTSMAKGIAAVLKMKQPNRNVDFRITEGLAVNGDKHSVQIILENLLGNAWKYTSKKEAALIELGMAEKDGGPTYYVRDNGVGFDMNQAHSLFAAFRRLDSQNEFEGFGIGLSLVQRIVQRHGGDIWAEGEIGKGATFYFTLGR